MGTACPAGIAQPLFATSPPLMILELLLALAAGLLTGALIAWYRRSRDN
jgi:uncharacterized protein involved in exopolysaccharide biosynthesis